MPSSHLLGQCIHSGQLILRQSSKIGATRCQILRLKCTEFDFHRVSVPDPAGELTALPQPLVVFKGQLLRWDGGNGDGSVLGGEARGGMPPYWGIFSASGGKLRRARRVACVCASRHFFFHVKHCVSVCLHLYIAEDMQWCVCGLGLCGCTYEHTCMSLSIHSGSTCNVFSSTYSSHSAYVVLFLAYLTDFCHWKCIYTVLIGFITIPCVSLVICPSHLCL